MKATLPKQLWHTDAGHLFAVAWIVRYLELQGSTSPSLRGALRVRVPSGGRPEDREGRGPGPKARIQALDKIAYADRPLSPSNWKSPSVNSLTQASTTSASYRVPLPPVISLMAASDSSARL